MSSFFRDFVHNLCLAENLVDVAPSGRASQSSVSRWSRPDDAQRAVSNVPTEFAFHTNKEDNPWWEITLESPKPISYIVLHNRRNPSFQVKSLSLEISVCQNSVWMPVFEGSVAFGAAPSSMPFVFPLGVRKQIEAVRITARQEGYFHLAKVELLSPEYLIKFAESRPIFIAKRSDGFGERMKAVLNAMVAAEALGGSFYIVWNEMLESIERDHSVQSREKTFSKKFIAGHLIEPRDFSVLSTKNSSAEGFSMTSFFASNRDAIIVEQAKITSRIPEVSRKIQPGAYARAFKKIEFSEPLERAREVARSIQISDSSVALHLRAGDIIYGRYRFTDLYIGKVITFPVAEHIISVENSNGNAVVLFGQDDDLCRYFASKYEVVLAGQLGDAFGFDDAQRALFEICLMSRCKKLYAGSSGFAVLASWIGECGIVPASGVVDDKAAVEVVAKYLLSVVKMSGLISPLQYSYAALVAVCSHHNHLESDARDRLLELGIKFDPENSFLVFLKCYFLYRDRRDKEADDLLLREIEREGEWGILSILTLKHNVTLTASRYVSELVSAADRQSAVSALCVALIRKAEGNSTEAIKYAEIYSSRKQRFFTPLDGLIDSILRADRK